MYKACVIVTCLYVLATFWFTCILYCFTLVEWSLLLCSPGCIAKEDKLEWLVNVLAHHTHLAHFRLSGSQIEAERMKRVCGVLCHMAHITSLNLGGNLFGDEGVKCVCDCIDHMPNINTLNLAYNNIGRSGAMCVCAALASKHHMTELNLFGGLCDVPLVAMI
eukprot:c13133_g1_i3.p1 GENE.c13133_g1_i3~~c13133_g1_i3.p1  ORF type:complete len:163 (-),score=47.77 c13133_g1_i3:298-786(-)